MKMPSLRFLIATTSAGMVAMAATACNNLEPTFIVEVAPAPNPDSARFVQS